MITKDNYFEKAAGIDFSNLPEALRNGHKLVQGASQNNWSAYNSNENISRVVKAYFEKLEQWLQKSPQEKPTPEKKTGTVKKTDTSKKPEPTPPMQRRLNHKGRKVDIRPASKNSAKFIVWDLKSDQKFANEKFDSIQEAKDFIDDNEMILVQTHSSSDESKSNPVERLDPEVQFIKRYAALHGKTKTQDEILRFLSSLQKAMLEKKIRKTSPYAAEIEKIQEQLIRCYEKMGDAIEINLDKKTLERYLEIAGSQKSMLSVSYIRQYINLHGKKNVKDKAKALMQRIKQAVEKKKLSSDDPYAARLDAIFQSLKKYTSGDTNTPVISKSELNGLMGIFSYMAKRQRKKKVARHLQKIYELERGMAGTEDEPIEEDMPLGDHAQVIPTAELAGMEFETIGLQGKYHDLIGDPCVGFSAMVFGLPKSGKSTLCIDFAKYLAEHHGKVLYCAIEEKFGYTLKEKVERLKAVHPKLYVAEEIPENFSDFNFVFIDSVSRANLTIEDLNRLRSDYPRVAFIFIFHTTKNGQFRGQNQFAHDVDVIIEVKDGKAKSNGRFNTSSEINFLKQNKKFSVILRSSNKRKMENYSDFDVQYNGNVSVEYGTDKFGKYFEVSGTLIKKYDGRKEFFSFEPGNFDIPEYEVIWDENLEDLEEDIIDKYFEWVQQKELERNK
jgi:hypothetical protein